MFNVQWLRFHSSLLNWKSSKCKPIGHLIFVLPVVWIFVKRTHLVHAWFVDLVVNCLFKHMSSWWRGLDSVCRHVCNAFSAFVCSLCLKDILLCNLVKTVQFLMSPGLNYFHLTPIRFTLIFCIVLKRPHSTSKTTTKNPSMKSEWTCTECYHGVFWK